MNLKRKRSGIKYEPAKAGDIKTKEKIMQIRKFTRISTESLKEGDSKGIFISGTSTLTVEGNKAILRTKNGTSVLQYNTVVPVANGYYAFYKEEDCDVMKLCFSQNKQEFGDYA